MKNGKNLAVQIIETATDSKVNAKTYLDINSANIVEIDLFAGRTNSEIKKIKESPSVVYIKATKETDGFYSATVEAIKELIINGLYIIALNATNSIGEVNLRINGTISKVLNKYQITSGNIVGLEKNDLLANLEYLFRYNGDSFVLVSSNALSLDGKSLEDFVLKSEVIDNVNSIDANIPLSAKQGKVLDEKITTEVNSINTRIDTEVDSIQREVNLKAPIDSPTFTGRVNGINNEMIGLGNVTNDLQVKKSEVGVANGVAPTDDNNLIPSSYLPSYVDDVLEFDYRDISQTSDIPIEGKLYFPEIGESGKIYVDNSENLTYRWGGTQYVEISKSLALGETPSTAYAGDKGKKNAEDIISLQNNKTDKPNEAITDHIAIFNTDKNIVDSGKVIVDFDVAGSADAVQNNLIEHIDNKTNPHETDKTQIGLGNVTNDAQIKRLEMGVANGVATLDLNSKLIQKINFSNIDGMPNSFPANGGNSDTVDGLHANNFTQRFSNLTSEIFNNVNYPVSYMGDIPNEDAITSGLPSAWWYIIYNPHRYLGGYSSQIAIPLNNNSELPRYRMAINGVWSAWLRFADGGNASSVPVGGVTNLCEAVTTLPNRAKIQTIHGTVSSSEAKFIDRLRFGNIYMFSFYWKRISGWTENKSVIGFPTSYFTGGDFSKNITGAFTGSFTFPLILGGYEVYGERGYVKCPVLNSTRNFIQLGTLLRDGYEVLLTEDDILSQIYHGVIFTSALI